MTDYQLGLLISIVSMVCFGIVGGLNKIPAQNLGATKTIFYRNLIVVLLLALVVAFNPLSVVWDFEHIVLTLLFGSIGYFGLYLLVKSLATGEVGLVVTVNNTKVIITAAIAAVFFSETLSLSQIILIVIILLGVLILSVDVRALQRSGVFKLHKGIGMSLTSALIFGIVLALYSIPIAVLGGLWFALILETLVLVISGGQILLDKKSLVFSQTEFKQNWKWISALGVAAAGGTLLFSLSYNYIGVTLTNTISVAAALVSVVFGMVVFNEKIKPRQYIAIAIIITCLIIFTAQI